MAASTSWAQSCADCIQIPRKDFELAKKAADEAEASRLLIPKLERENELLKENSQLKDQVIQAQRETIELQTQQSAEKDKTIAAEQAAREATEKQLALETKEKLKAQASTKVWRKIGTVAGAAAAVLLFGIIH